MRNTSPKDNSNTGASDDSATVRGLITVFAACMFAGKSTQLKEVRDNLLRFDKAVLAFKPERDDRCSTSHIETHKKEKLDCQIISHSGELFTYANNNPHVKSFLLDEAQFLDDDITTNVISLATIGINFYIAGLNMDSFGMPLPSLSSV